MGVPQGSILGPLFYTIFTNELPEVVQQEILNQGEDFPEYNLHHEENGSICCYADDATYSCLAKDPTTLSAMFLRIAEFMNSNKLKLNDSKTNLLVVNSGRPKSRILPGEN